MAKSTCSQKKEVDSDLQNSSECGMFDMRWCMNWGRGESSFFYSSKEAKKSVFERGGCVYACVYACVWVGGFEVQAGKVSK